MTSVLNSQKRQGVHTSDSVAIAEINRRGVTIVTIISDSDLAQSKSLAGTIEARRNSDEWEVLARFTWEGPTVETETPSVSLSSARTKGRDVRLVLDLLDEITVGATITER